MNEKGLTFSVDFSTLFVLVIITRRTSSQMPVRTIRISWSWHALWSCSQKLFVAFLHTQKDCLQNFVVWSWISLTSICSETTLAWTIPTSGMNFQCVGCSLYCVGGSQWSCWGRTEAKIPRFSPQQKTLVKSIFCNCCSCWKMWFNQITLIWFCDRAPLIILSGQIHIKKKALDMEHKYTTGIPVYWY